MNQPWVYMCSPSWTPLPPPSPSHPLGHPSAPALSTLSHASNLDWQSVSHMIIYTFQCYSLRSSHPCLLPQSQKKNCSINLCLFCCLAYRVIDNHLSKFHIYALVWHLVPSLYGKCFPITSIDGETVETVSDFIFGGSKITADSDCSHEMKRRLLLGRKVMTNLDSIFKKQRHYFANKGPSSQGYGFSSSRIWMWELNCEESWALKNWCFWTVVLERTRESLGLQGDPTSPL